MNPLRPLLWMLFFLSVAAVLQARVAHAIGIRGAQPDLLLLTLACGATLTGRARGAILGVWAGLLTASLVPLTFGTFLVSRTLAGLLMGVLQRLLIRDSLVVPPLAVLATTLAAEAVYVLMAPNAARYHVRQWAVGVAGETLYNVCLSVPVYFLLRRIVGPTEARDPFAPV